MKGNDTNAKRLVEVALPLSEINDASAYDKLPGIGAHPKRMHQWWARLPLPVARAMIFASLVPDPSSREDLDPEQELAERERLFSIIRDLMSKKAHEKPELFLKAREEIESAIDGEPLSCLDPFSGGGSIPLEAQRLGLPTIAADLNPVAAILTKALVDLPMRFAGSRPVNPDATSQSRLGEPNWRGSKGLAEDIRYYGERILAVARKEIGEYFPSLIVPEEAADRRPSLRRHGGKQVTPLGWIWARLVKCPNPACGEWFPVVKSFKLSTKKDDRIWAEPLIDKTSGTVSFKVREGEGEVPKKTKTRWKTICLFCGKDNISNEELREQASTHGIRKQMMAAIGDGDPGRLYLDPVDLPPVEELGETAWLDREMPDNTRWFSPPGYGMDTYRDLFTDRQLLALGTFVDLIHSHIPEIEEAAEQRGMNPDGVGVADGGRGAKAYAETIATYLAFAVDRLADYNCKLSHWKPSGEQQMHLFTRQAIPMVWDFPEANVLGETGITWSNQLQYVSNAVETIVVDGGEPATVTQGSILDLEISGPLIVSTDPPYYDNMGYSGISDFFYVWLRHTLGNIYPDIFSTILTPKKDELVADPHKFGGDKEKARDHFESGFTSGFRKLREAMDPRFPLTIYYAFKQDEDSYELGEGDEARITLTTGWETVLNALLSGGFQITATWPVRASQRWRMVASGTNALASYIVLSCRPRSEDAPVCTKREFTSELSSQLPDALDKLQQGNIAPVDLAQAALGPGMAIFSKYQKVLEADGSSMSVRTAIRLINRELDAFLSAEEGDMDPDTQFAVAWFEQQGMEAGDYGEAEVLFTAKGVAGEGVEQAGIAEVRKGKVRLLKREELEDSWDPREDARLTVWESTQHLIRTLQEDGEEEAAKLIARLPSGTASDARDLAYRLYSICERKDWADEALAYNNLVVEWPRLQEMAYRFSDEWEGPLDRYTKED